MESIWQNILHILKILLLSSFFYNTFIIIYLSIGGPERGYEEYILTTLFFTLAWAIFNAICLLVISPVTLIILIIKNLLPNINGLLYLFCYLFFLKLFGIMNFRHISKIQEN